MLAALGQFCSALYWRLNKFWTILISVTVPLVLIFGSVPLISWLGTTSAGRAAVEALAAFGQFLAASPGTRRRCCWPWGRRSSPSAGCCCAGHDPACKVTDSER
ncbi:MAG: hypothetical protein ACLTYN_06915 [Dysosmobacter welbionis]